MLAVLTFGLVWLTAVVPSAEASFPGRNGLIAFAGEGPPFNTNRVPEGAWTIRVVNPRSGRTRQLTRVSRRCGRRGWTWGDYEPSFSASGRLLVYVHSDECDPRTPDGIYVMRADGSGRRLIRRTHLDRDIDSTEALEFPAFSPSARFVAFDDYLQEMHIIRMPLPHEAALSINCQFNGTRCRTFELARYLYPGQPRFSSTGRLAVTLTVDRGAYDAGHIGTVAFDGEGLRLVGPPRLVTHSRRDGQPDWSPRADRIVFQREKSTSRALNGDVFVAPAGGERHRRPRRLTETRDAFFPVWSPNGRRIAYVRGRFGLNGTLWTMRARDGRAQRLVATDVVIDRIGWQPRPRYCALVDARSANPANRNSSARRRGSRRP
jgi:Tol biopolymer transport system component